MSLENNTVNKHFMMMFNFLNKKKWINHNKAYDNIYIVDREF